MPETRADSTVIDPRAGVRIGAAVELWHVRRFLEELTQAPERRRRTAIGGARGTGKTGVLHAAVGRLRSEGAAVNIGMQAVVGQSPGSTVDAGSYLVLDDAHELSDDACELIARQVIRPDGPSLIIGYRPDLASPKLIELVRLLGSYEQPIALGPLDAASAKAWIERNAPGIDATQRTHIVRETAGLPWLLSSIVDAIIRQDDRHTTDADLDAVLRSARISIAAGIERELALAPPAIHDVAVALAVGFEPEDLLAAPDLFTTLDPSSGTSSREEVEVELDAALTRLRAAGLLGRRDALAPAVAEGIVSIEPGYRTQRLRRRLMRARTERGLPVIGLARELARGGVRDEDVAEVLIAEADGVLAADPAQARELYELARSAGADGLALAARSAQAALADGSFDDAVAALDARPDDPAQDGAAAYCATSAALWLRMGSPDRAADVLEWLGASEAARIADHAALTYMATGRGADAAAALAGATASFPGLANAGLRTATEAVVASGNSTGDAPTTVLTALVRASEMMTATGGATLLPECVGVLAGTVALQTGRADVAGEILDRAIRGNQGGREAASRLTLLRGWAALLNGDTADARARLGQVDEPLTPRDDLLRSALAVALARRDDDAPGLLRAWPRARAALLRVSVSLFDLIPLAELVLAAERLRDDAVDGPLHQALQLLERLGEPPLWGAQLHWACVQVAIRRNRPRDLAPHAGALARGADQLALAGALANAGRVWVALLGGHRDAADFENVEQAARELSTCGFGWDGARLLGWAAALVQDREIMNRLLQTARELSLARPEPALAAPAHAPEPGDEQTAATPDAVLSDREREVGRLVAEGRTYAEIGGVLFISPRTVEHHVARMRARLGCNSRADLIARLRAMFGD